MSETTDAIRLQKCGRFHRDSEPLSCECASETTDARLAAIQRAWVDANYEADPSQLHVETLKRDVTFLLALLQSRTDEAEKQRTKAASWQRIVRQYERERDAAVEEAGKFWEALRELAKAADDGHDYDAHEEHPPEDGPLPDECDLCAKLARALAALSAAERDER